MRGFRCFLVRRKRLHRRWRIDADSLSRLSIGIRGKEAFAYAAKKAGYRLTSAKPGCYVTVIRIGYRIDSSQRPEASGNLARIRVRDGASGWPLGQEFDVKDT